MGIVVVSCSDDDLVDGARKTYHSGDAIEFGVSASVPAGNENSKNSRTIYGDHNVNANGDGKIDINWVKDDLLDIACPQASVTQLATYGIPEVGDDPSKVTGLQLVSPAAGLRWNGDGDHDFYGIYPSKTVFDDKVKYPETMVEKPSFELKITDKGKQAVGFLPLNYTAKVHTTGQTADGKNTVYTISPNMDYAFMVAKNTTNLAAVNTSGLALEFQPLATALSFEIKANLVHGGSSANSSEILLDHIELVSKTKNISGKFVYDFETGELKNTSTDSRNHMNMYLNYKGMDVAKQGIKLKNGDVCKVNFFLMPEYDLDPNDLQVRIWFIVGGQYQRQRVATLGKEIKMRHMYVYKNFQLPKISVDITGSTWFSAVDDRALMNQVSMICAGNAFSSAERIPWANREQVLDYKKLWDYGVRAFEFVTQSCARTGYKDEEYPEVGLMNEHFVCGELEMDGKEDPYNPNKDKNIVSATFGEAFANLAKFLIRDEYKEYHNETLVLITRYHAVCDGYNPSRYVKNLSDFLFYAAKTGVKDDEGVTFTVPADKYVLLTSASTAGDLKGKIAIVVRPGDDAYCEYAGKPLTGVAREQLASPWKEKLCYVENWGSAYDRWDTRYSGFQREGTWAKISEGTENYAASVFESYLWGVGRNSTTVDNSKAPEMQLLLNWWDGTSSYQPGPNSTYLTSYDFKTGKPLEQFNFVHKVNGNVAGGYIQEWARVVSSDFAWGKGVLPADLNDEQVKGEALSAEYHYKKGPDNADYKGTAHLWFRWPESYAQKMRAVKDVFRKSVERVGADREPFCINVLSGYFADKYHNNSFEPFQASFQAFVKNNPGNSQTITFTPRGQGNGGNYAALAARINSDVFDYLTSTKLKQGPWGLVQVDYLGATAAEFEKWSGPETGVEKGNNARLHGGDAWTAEVASRNLMKLFIVNNFAFPLKKGAPDKASIEVDTTPKDEIIITD